MPGKIYVRQHLKIPRYDVPEGNLLQLYLEACEEMQVTANTGAAYQLLRRSRIMQALPFHMVADLDESSLVELMWRHLDVKQNGGVKLERLLGACSAINPTCDLAAALGSAEWLAQSSSTEVGHAEFDAAVGAAVLSLEEAGRLEALRCGVMEVVAFQDQIESLSRQGMLHAAFKEMDVTGEGALPVSELQALLLRVHPALDLQRLAAMRPYLFSYAGNMAPEADCLELMAAACEELTDRQLITGVYEVLDFKVRSRHAYDFSRCYVGDRGALPLIRALQADPSFTALNLSSCGLSSGAVQALVDMLVTHPCITSLDVSNNPISDEGGVMLTWLLENNNNIVNCNIDKTYLLRNYSRTHHDHLGPSPCEDGAPLFQALDANRSSRRSSTDEVVAVLRDHHVEIKALFWALADGKGRVPLETLQAALMEEGAEWGCQPDVLREVVHSDRLLGMETVKRTADLSGQLHVSFAEFMHFLRSENLVLRVCHATRHHRLQVKRIFYGIMQDDKASLLKLRDEVAAVALEAGSGWNISLTDLQHVFCPDVFLPHVQRPPPPAQGEGEAMPMTASLERPAAEVMEGDMALTWPQFFWTVLHLYNR